MTAVLLLALIFALGAKFIDMMFVLLWALRRSNQFLNTLVTMPALAEPQFKALVSMHGYPDYHAWIGKLLPNGPFILHRLLAVVSSYHFLTISSALTVIILSYQNAPSVAIQTWSALLTSILLASLWVKLTGMTFFNIPLRNDFREGLVFFTFRHLVIWFLAVCVCDVLAYAALYSVQLVSTSDSIQRYIIAAIYTGATVLITSSPPAGSLDTNNPYVQIFITSQMASSLLLLVVLISALSLVADTIRRP
jgi:hypothetical protein